VIVIRSKSSGRYVGSGDVMRFVDEASDAHVFESVTQAEGYILDIISKGDADNYGYQRQNLDILDNGKAAKVDNTKINRDGPSGYGW
jgi:hypothetical protein